MSESVHVIPIFIPYVNRPDLLNLAIASVPDSRKDRLTQLIVINNSGIDLLGSECSGYTNPPVPLSFSQTQNWMLKIAMEWMAPFYLFMHSDASCEPWVVDTLIQTAEEQTEPWGAIFTAYDALATYNTEAFKAIGGWDTNLVWYGAEQDAYHRLRLAGYPTRETGLPVKHDPSQTMKADPAIHRAVNLGAAFRDFYYIQKWGGLPGHEQFQAPFNGRV